MDGKVMKISKQDVMNYLNKGPEHMKSCLKELTGRIRQLTTMMGALLEDDPITAMIVGLRIETKVYDKHGDVLLDTYTGGMMVDTVTEPAKGDKEDEGISDTDAD